MEHKKKNRLLELGKDLLIILLALSALHLVGRTSFYSGATAQNWLSGVLSILPRREAPSDLRPAGGWGQGGVLRPARIALRSEVSRYGVQYDSEKTAELFAQLVNPLADALTEAQAPVSISRRTWQDTLSAQRPSAYVDFQGSVPLADLAVWLNGGQNVNPNLSGAARRLILAQGADGGVTLSYLSESDGKYYACATDPGLAQRLAALVEGVPNNAVFAFEDPDRYGALAPYTLVCQDAPQPRRYAAANPIPLPNPLPSPVSLAASPALDDFIRGLSFPPQSYTAYPITNGVSIQEGGDRLTVSSAGEVTFRASGEGEPRYPVAAGAGSAPWQLIDGAWAFVEKTLSPLCGSAGFWLSSCEETSDGLEVCFSYLLDGAPVHLSRDGWAARLLLRDGAIVEFTLRLRSYTPADGTTLVLQEHRAAAAMRTLQAQGAELLLCYEDQGSAQLSARWTAW